MSCVKNSSKYFKGVEHVSQLFGKLGPDCEVNGGTWIGTRSVDHSSGSVHKSIALWTELSVSLLSDSLSLSLEELDAELILDNCLRFIANWACDALVISAGSNPPKTLSELIAGIWIYCKIIYIHRKQKKFSLDNWLKFCSQISYWWNQSDVDSDDVPKYL